MPETITPGPTEEYAAEILSRGGIDDCTELELVAMTPAERVALVYHAETVLLRTLDEVRKQVEVTVHLAARAVGSVVRDEALDIFLAD